jgi:hypothetical protein
MGKIVKCFFMSFVLLTIILICFNFSIAGEIDSDNDGWPDQFEEKLSADPKDSINTPDPLADNDLDGLVNEKERDWGTDPTDPDTDNDNLSDSQEIIWKISDPLDSDLFINPEKSKAKIRKEPLNNQSVRSVIEN